MDGSERDVPPSIDGSTIAKLSAVLHIARRRTLGLRERAAADQPVTPWRIAEALQELDVAHEELRVAEEELYTQADALAVSSSATIGESEEFRETFDEAPAAYVITDAAGLIQRANREAHRLFGVDIGLLPGKPLPNFVAVPDRSPLRELFMRDAAPNVITRRELTIVPRGAVPRSPVRVSLACSWRVASAAPRFWILMSEIGTDYSEHVDPASEPLGHMEPPSLLAQSARSPQSLATLDQEFRSPLNNVKGWLQLLADRAASQQLRVRAQGGISRNVELVTRLLDALIEQARLEAELVELTPQATSVRRLIHELVESQQAHAGAAGLVLTCESSSDSLAMRVDPGRVRQIMLALLSNAFAVTPPGGVVAVRVARQAAGARISVRDTGRGLASQDLERIFKPFLRLANGERHTPGLGLGLTIGRQLAELHGGSLKVESDGLGKGATFHLELADHEDDSVLRQRSTHSAPSVTLEPLSNGVDEAM
jgi:PAS domain S-box-containing protein